MRIIHALQRIAISVAIACILFPVTTHADTYQWSTDFAGCGFDDYVSDMVDFNGNLVVCGNFTHQSAVSADKVAMWDGAQWTTMGDTPFFQANQVAVYNNQVYLMGLVQFAFSPRPLMRFNGSGWDTAYSFTQGGYVGDTRAMLEYNGLLLIAGDIADGYSGPANLVAFDGVNVSDIPGKPYLLGGDLVIFDMVEFQGDLFVTGNFEMTVDSIATHGLASWDGSTWSPVAGRSGLGQPLNEGILNDIWDSGYALAVYDNKLYVAGEFSMAGDLPVSNLVSWDPATELWENVGGGSPDPVFEVASYGGSLFAAGTLDTLGGVPVTNVGRWNGSAWSAVGTGTSGPVNEMMAYGSDLLVGGDFGTAGTAHAANLAWWDGASFASHNAPCGNGLDATVLGFSEFDGNLIAVGDFEYAGDVRAGGVAAYDGASWSALGSGANSYVRNAAADATRLVVVGDFTEIDGIPANYVAVWNGSAWSALGPGLPASSSAVCFHNGDIYAAGLASTPGGLSAYVRYWNGSSWVDIVDPVSNLKTYRIASYDGRLFVGYDVWDGSTWSVVPCGYSEFNVNMLDVCAGDLYIASSTSQSFCGGAYTPALVYDGTSSAGLSPNTFESPGFDGTPYAIVEFDGMKVLAGQGNYDGGRIFSLAPGASQWNVFAGDVNSSIYAMHVYNGDLYAAGFFNAVATVDTGGTASSKIARVGAVVSDADTPSPRGVALSPNVPNPFNPETSISFTTPGGTATLAVYDVRGRRVRTIVSGALSAGRHTARWDGRNDSGEAVASGVYFCRLRAGERTLTRKMVLAK